MSAERQITKSSESEVTKAIEEVALESKLIQTDKKVGEIIDAQFLSEDDDMPGGVDSEKDAVETIEQRADEFCELFHERYEAGNTSLTQKQEGEALRKARFQRYSIKKNLNELEETINEYTYSPGQRRIKLTVQLPGGGIVTEIYDFPEYWDEKSEFVKLFKYGIRDVNSVTGEVLPKDELDIDRLEGCVVPIADVEDDYFVFVPSSPHYTSEKTSSDGKDIESRMSGIFTRLLIYILSFSLSVMFVQLIL